MTFVFVGASGFVGRHAFDHALRRGHVVWGTSRRATGPRALSYDMRSDRLAPLLESVPRDPAAPNVGVICASVRQIDTCRRESALARQINVTATIAALQDLAERGFRPVFLSSSYVFSGAEGYYNERDAVGPVCAYGRHKVEVEQWMAEHVPEGLILRLDKVVGPLDDGPHLFTEWRDLSERGLSIECIAGQVLSPTNVTDIAAGIVAACERGLRGTYHVANPEFFTREELAAQFCRAIDVRPQIIVKPQRDFQFADVRPLKTYLDSSAFTAATKLRFTTMSETWRRGRGADS